MVKKFFQAKKIPVALYMKILHEKLKKSKIFCIYEGKDNIYYSPIVDKLNNGKYEIENLHADGKDNVLKIYELLQAHKINVRVLFFIDRDFNTYSSINENDIYLTKGYSIENFYTGENIFCKICENDLYCKKIYIKGLLSNFKRSKIQFHDLIEYINQIGKYCKSKNIDCDMNNFKVTKEFNIFYNNIEYKNPSEWDISSLKIKLMINKVLKENKIRLIPFVDKSHEFRGKNELDFFIKFLEINKKHIEDNNLKSNNYAIKIINNKEDFMNTYSKYAEIPGELENYIRTKLS